MNHLHAMRRIREDLVARLEACDWSIRQLEAMDDRRGEPAPAAIDHSPPSPVPVHLFVPPPAPVEPGPKVPSPWAKPSTKTDAIVELLAKHGKPMTALEIARETRQVDAAVAALLRFAEKKGQVERCGKRPGHGAPPATLWRVAGSRATAGCGPSAPVPSAPAAPGPVLQTVRPEPSAAAHPAPPPQPAPKPAAPAAGPAHELTDGERKQFRGAPRKGQVWQGSGLTRIVQGVTFDPSRPDTYRVSFTQPPGALPQLMYRGAWEAWTSNAKCIKEPQ